MKMWILIWVLVVPPSAAASSAESIYPAPLVQLLVDASPFKGKMVRVKGYLAHDERLYLTKDHAAMFDSESSILVETREGADITRTACMDNWISLTARLEEREPGGFLLTEIKSAFAPLTKERSCLRDWKPR